MKGIVVVTGVNMTLAKVLFKNGNPATLVKKARDCYKMNAAGGCATVLNQSEWLVYMTGYKYEVLESMALEMMKPPYYLKEANLQDKNAVKEIANEVSSLKKETGLPVHVVHYGGASDTKVELPNSSVFGIPWEIPGEAIPDLVANNCTTLFNVLQAFREIFSKQDVSKIVFVTAITALRTKLEHALDAAQKGAGHAVARSLALDLTKEKIYVTEVMPGITDTGFYDNPHTFESIVRASSALGYDYTQDNFPVFSAEKVGEAVRFVLEMEAYVREISIMPYGQYPHLGA